MITERQLQILNVIVEDYVELGQPIGSKSIIERHQLPISPATVRNEMKQLEELELLEKTHTSSGRVPSEKGIRHYVDQLLKVKSRSKQSIDWFNQFYDDNQYDVNAMLKWLALEISNRSHYTTVVLGPNKFSRHIFEIHFVRVNPNHLMSVIVFADGYVEKVHLQISKLITHEQIEKFMNYLNLHFKQNTLSTLINTLESLTLSFIDQQFINNFKYALITQINDQNEEMFLGGKMHLIEALNVSNVSMIQSILKYLESERIAQFLNETANDSISVNIGQEINQDLEGISIVSTSYEISGDISGHLAVIGPTAMHYNKVIQLLNHF
ncbi:MULTISPECIES: heat-inducible transcriptional repressor HrcA [Mammaliicoccus]|jgi:heat-inducible transcriptional repressor|uniref:Heat-inducible transcription repressor HrcA n=1 Tax=Mammaliicoccus lentus TaxID=42858 RepID=A0ABS6GXD6_MAMLE|nr:MULTISPECIES: heat-inducible transcriptional repressor HrcA [Mammaliicoccus]HBV03790.1 heat-inducible transcription repressor HrcA [Staphylococcus sp.]MBF0747955.1 heat-inducible transcription repressor HrcA [Mammaliicoccus lentus]MBF0793471.1 heat-inducible transcription repressor HrcA [Mammaliicoccus lentus]MBF0842400.1 heat-inducible transcription repressor HrcA [Mammaliicoccus lentus]MBU6113208.1 heat-inducible transcriptional repressor HrcA [Mammaliicoccus lentus]